ncbi:MAG: glutamyl-tRNA reductase, partial [Actinobacteria bacterium]|nr:glutamyl-tRNA reductase [Actinomycetota bacterium]
MFLSYSFTHRRVEFALLEQLARAERQIALAIDSPAYADGSVILATCNRFEIYLETSEERAALLPALLAESTDLPVEMLDAAAETRRGDAVSGHVFGVAAGLDSVALGEEEIAGQLRRAHVAAAARGTLTDGLERLFQAAARTGRAVRARTSIRATGRSLVQLALQRAAPALPPWREVRVLLIGTGAY